MDNWLLETFPEARVFFTGPPASAAPATVADAAAPKGTLFQNNVQSAGPVAQTGGVAKPPARRRQPPPGKDEVEAVLAGKDLKKKIEKLKDWGIPTFPDDEEPPTQLNKYFKDLHSGTEKAKQYLDYLHKAGDYLHKFGQKLEAVEKVAKDLHAIADRLGKGLSSINKALGKVEHFAKWAEAADQFAVASQGLDPQKRETVGPWVKSMEHLWNATAPVGDWLKDKKTKALFAAAQETEASAGMAAAEAEAIAVAGTVLSIAGALIMVGIGALEAGVKVVNAYLDRYDQIMKEIERQKGTQAADPQPPAPGAWETEDDRLKQRDDDVRRVMQERRADAEWAEDMARGEAVQKAKDEFDAGFVTIYQKSRRNIVAQIEEAVGKISQSDQRGDRSSDIPIARTWENCLASQGLGESWRVISHVSDKVALDEISRLKHNNCPYVVTLYNYEMKSYVNNAMKDYGKTAEKTN